MQYTGTDGSIEINGEQLLLRRFGAVGRGRGSQPSTRVIPLGAISGVRFKEPGRIANGYLQLLLGGQDRPEPKAMSMDPDAVR